MPSERLAFRSAPGAGPPGSTRPDPSLTLRPSPRPCKPDYRLDAAGNYTDDQQTWTKPLSIEIVPAK